MCSSVCSSEGDAKSRLPIVGDVDMVEHHDPVFRRVAGPLQAAADAATAGPASVEAQQGAEHEAHTERACREQVGGPPPLLFAVAAGVARQHPRE